MTFAGRAVRRAAGLLVALLCLATATPCLGADWKRLDSPNFIVIGNVGANDLRDIAREFEGFRETVGRLLGQRASGTAVPTIVIVFASDRDFTPFKLRYKGKPVSVTGVFVGGPDIDHIAMIADTGDTPASILFHEYTHEVVSNAFRQPPVWFSEGFAEYFSTFQMRDGGRRALVGRPISSHVLRLREATLLPIATLLTVDRGSPFYNETEKRRIFYAESWALVHLLLMDPARRPQLAKFLAGVAEGGAPVEVWGRVFGDGMDQALRQYVQRAAFSYNQYDFPESVATLEARRVPLSEADVQAFLAGLLLGQRRLDEAAERLSSATKLDPANQRARVLLAKLDNARGDAGSAARRLADLPEMDDWVVAYDAATEIARMVESQAGWAQPDQLAAARTLFDQVQRQRGDVANALARRVSLELQMAEGPSAESLKSIERARSLAPGRDDYAFLHALVLARQNDFRAARNVIGPFMTAAYAPDVRERARSVMEFIVRAEEGARARAAALAAAADRPPTPPPTAPPAPVANPRDAPSRATEPLFRPLQAGEFRLEGTLERIGCTPSGGAIFLVRTPGGPVTASAARMAEVDFITYRDDLRGSVACGVLKEPMPVFVTWRAGTPAGTKQVVAIEFLPKPGR